MKVRQTQTPDDSIRTALLLAPVIFLTDGKTNLPVSNTSEALARFEPVVVHIEFLRREIMNEARELVDTELDIVCGGGLVDINFGNIDVNPQIATQVGLAIGGLSVFGNGGSASIAQLLNMSSISSLGK